MNQEETGRLNSATKYPSIRTYHQLDPKNGKLLEDTALPFGDGPVVLTEKVDGTNGRIVILPDGDWFIGSREELLYARGDRIENPALGIVPALLPLAPELASLTENIRVYFLEVYGRGVGPAAKQYASSGLTGYRLFDVALADPSVLDWDVSKIASWREHEGQLFLSEDNLTADAKLFSLPLTPRLGEVPAPDLPVNLAVMQAFLHRHLPVSRCLLDEGAGGTPEGIVLRTRDRGVIAKARFADYARTLQPRPSGKDRKEGKAS